MSGTPHDKIKKIGELAAVLTQLRKEGKKTVLCHGVFDILHPGHIRHLEAARREGDLLVVTVTPDRFVNKGPGRPIFPAELRAEVLASLSPVDFVAVNEWPTAVQTLLQLKPDVYVKGGDYQDRSKDLTGKITEEEEAVKSVGGKVVFTDEITFSSSSLVNNFLNFYSEETSSFLKDFRERFSADTIVNYLNRVSDCRVLVLGDVIIDEYRYCSPMGKAAKENVIATRYEGEETFAGGVLAAANHVAGFCHQVDLVTLLGTENNYEEFVRSHLKRNVRPQFFLRQDAPTVVKRRYVEPGYMRKLFEICFVNGSYIPADVERNFLDYLDPILPNYDLVLVTDFGHGLMTPALIDLVCKKARFLAVTAQTNSANAGFNLVTKYPKADYLCIDEPEARLAMQDCVNDLETVIQRLGEKLNCPHLSITHGRRGCLVYSRREELFRIPVLTRTVVDTVGAGDAFLSVTAPCVATGVPMPVVGFVGNAAGAMKVGIVGNRSSVEKVPLLKFISTLLK